MNPGANGNRNTVTDTPTGQGAVTSRYCYTAGDRLTATQGGPAPIASMSYDPHGSATDVSGETHTYDSADRHLSTTAGATTVNYTRDAVLDTNNNVTERDIALPGGVILTRRATGGDTWSYPNVHGDVVATCDGAGTVTGTNYSYDPFGNPTATGAAVPDNSAGSYDYGWLGNKQRGLEHQLGLRPVIEMGARQYDPTLGRFYETDPVEGGSANNYDYGNQNPITNFDLDGNYCWGHHCVHAPHASHFYRHATRHFRQS